ncbi:MAG: hypothetical protein HY698_16865 [Deltaproteobacteria bacterium]|nr:hypothetical protein [Deltaproteobacteria bacterium]
MRRKEWWSILASVALSVPLVVPAHGSPAFGPSAAAPQGVGTVTARHVRVGAKRPSFEAGTLSTPGRGTPAEIARAYVSSGPSVLRGIDPSTLELEATRRGEDGSMVKFRQVFRGIEVFGARAAVRLDSDGRVRWISGEALAIPPGFDVTPRIGAEAAIEVVLSGHEGDMKPIVKASDHAKLVIFAFHPEATPRLAWQVRLPADLARREVIQAIIDAQTGAVLRVENIAREAAEHKAKVWKFNPRSEGANTPLIETSLETLPQAATQLIDRDIVVQNCIDERKCRKVSFGGFNGSIHSCTFKPTVTTNEEGNFLHVTRPTNEKEPEDQFAEVQMYYHVSKIYSAFRGWIGPEFKLKDAPITAIVNAKIPGGYREALCQEPAGGGEAVAPAASTLVGFENALFTPKGGFGGGFPEEDSIIFGEGTIGDAAYDGDVVYHEFGHAVMNKVLPNYQPVVPDEYGLDATAGGLIEGYPDYFSAAVTEDPKLGEYFGAALPGGVVRHLENTKTCPADLWNEVHQDSEFFTAALWSVRKSLSDEDQVKMDKAIFRVMDSLSVYDAMEAAAAKSVAELELSVNAQVATKLKEAFQARGVLGCNHRVLDMKGTSVKDFFMLNGAEDIGQPIAPGPMQFKLDLPEDSVEIKVTIRGTQSGGFGGFGGSRTPPALKLLVKAGDEPIKWNWNVNPITHDATAVGDISLVSRGGGGGAVSGAFPKGTYHVMIANEGAGVGVEGVSFAHTAGHLPTPDAGSEANHPASDAGTDGHAEKEDEDCGCRVGGAGRGPSGAVLLGLVGFLIVLTRRRRA